ncbi:MAG: ZIP family metal transporter [Candidatus Binatia bacterium]
MTTFLWIFFSGLVMSAIALAGSVTLFLSEAALKKLLLPLVALAAGTLLGGALLHMIPAAIEKSGNRLSIFLWILLGFTLFLALEQFLHWHHCHRAPSEHQPLTYLILIADGVHNFIGGLAVAGAFLIDVRVGIALGSPLPPMKCRKNLETSVFSSTAAGRKAGHCSTTSFQRLLSWSAASSRMVRLSPSI